nr:hypothetical protein [uncultured Pseudodesulfovibrio sp.]
MRKSSQKPPITPQFQLCSDDFGNFARLARTSDNVLVSPKLDGFRCGADGYGLKLFSRNGFPLEFGEHFNAALIHLTYELEFFCCGSAVFDSELDHPEGIEVLREIVQGHIESRYHELRLNIFDICLPDTPLTSRTEALARAFERMGPGPVRLVRHCPLAGSLSDNIFDLYRDQFVDDGFEGAVFKVADAPYLPGLSPFWLRRVPFQSVDLPVSRVEAVEGREEIKAIVCLHGEVPVRITSGLTTEMKRTLYRDCPDVVEVFHRGVTRRGSLRNPVFRRPRPDKAVHSGN